MTVFTVGLLSDTHIPHRLERLPAPVLDALAGVDLILHAGDVDDPVALEPLRAVAPVHGVRGNVHFQEFSDGGAALQQMATGLGEYRSAIEALGKATQAIAKARQEMTDQQKEIVRISDSLYQFQLDQLDVESAAARMRLIVSALLALVLGMLAAWLITRQIILPLRATLADVERIASGDLSATAQVQRRDELGVLQRGIQQMGSKDKTFIMTQSGHIAGIVNPPSKGKYGHYTNDDMSLDYKDWLAGAAFHKGSWWPRWGSWLENHSGGLVEARIPGAEGREILCDAPGTYVTRKARG